MKIDDLIGKRYKEGGRGPDEYDCFGLFEELCRRRGVPVPEQSTPPAVEDKARMLATNVARDWKKIDGPQPGCGVAFRVIPPYVTHVGMVLDCGHKFIHIREGANVAVERLDSLLWRSRIAGYYAHV